VTFYGPGDRILDLVPRARVVDLRELGLNEWQIGAVLYAKEEGRITNTEYQQLCKVSKRTASNELSELGAKGLLERVGTRGKGGVCAIYYPKLAISWRLVGDCGVLEMDRHAQPPLSLARVAYFETALRSTADDQ